jgi:hypothetical protein
VIDSIDMSVLVPAGNQPNRYSDEFIGTHRVWLQRSPTSVLYEPRKPDGSESVLGLTKAQQRRLERAALRPWQVRVEQTATLVFEVPALGAFASKMHHPSRRALHLRMNGPVGLRAKGYPATAGAEPHWADTTWAETPEDARKARNAQRRRRQGR